MRWEYYRTFFAECRKFMKLSQFCKLCGIKQNHLSNFINYGITEISLDKLDLLYQTICDYCEKIV